MLFCLAFLCTSAGLLFFFVTKTLYFASEQSLCDTAKSALWVMLVSIGCLDGHAATSTEATYEISWRRFGCYPCCIHVVVIHLIDLCYFSDGWIGRPQSIYKTHLNKFPQFLNTILIKWLAYFCSLTRNSLSYIFTFVWLHYRVWYLKS